MHEFMILAQLSRRPMHGYMIAKIVGAMIGPFKQIQWGALYPVLSRLEHEGLIRAEEQEEGDGRPRKVYSLTEEGRERLHDHLMDTDRHLGEYFALFPLKVAFFTCSPQPSASGWLDIMPSMRSSTSITWFGSAERSRRCRC